MFNSKKISIGKGLYEKLASGAEQSGYSSTEEYIKHLLEKEVAKLGDDQDQKLAEDQLRGLGYLE